VRWSARSVGRAKTLLEGAGSGFRCGRVLERLGKGLAVRVPLGFRIMQVGADFVLGVLEDDLGVEQVQLYRLIKPG
jgi:hypothetical protein